MEAGTLLGVVSIVVAVGLYVVSPTIFQAIWGRPKLVFDWQRDYDEMIELNLVIRNPPVLSKWLHRFNVTRSPVNLSGRYKIWNARDKIIDSGSLLFVLENKEPSTSVMLTDHDTARSICASMYQGYHPFRAMVGKWYDDAESEFLQPGTYRFDVELSMSVGRRNVTRRFQVAKTEINWLPAD